MENRQCVRYNVVDAEPRSVYFFEKRRDKRVKRDRGEKMAGFKGKYPKWCKVGYLNAEDKKWVREALASGWSCREISRELRKDHVYVSKSAIGRYAQWWRARAAS